MNSRYNPNYGYVDYIRADFSCLMDGGVGDRGGADGIGGVGVVAGVGGGRRGRWER